MLSRRLTGSFFLPVLLALGALPSGAAQNEEDLKADLSFFTDESCRELKKEVQRKDLTRFRSKLLRNVASQLLEDRYDPTYRAASYEAYPSPQALQRTIKLGDGFSRYENITGIHLGKGEHVVLVGDSGGRNSPSFSPTGCASPRPGSNPPRTRPDGA